MVYDQAGAPVGSVDVGSNLVTLRAAGRVFVVNATRNGFDRLPMTFLHTTADCSGDRYLPNINGAGFAPYAYVSGTSLVFTEHVDPTNAANVAILTQETLAPGQDLATPGVCEPSWPQSAGLVTVIDDPSIAALVPPFALR
jgi:hypothetical protein